MRTTGRLKYQKEKSGRWKSYIKVMCGNKSKKRSMKYKN